ncbi:MAG: PTS sugar transporter subunit IIA [Planctomycetota bacterium]
MIQLLRNGFVCLELDLPEPEPLDEESHRRRWVRDQKEAVIREIVRLFDQTGRVSNQSALFEDLWNREKRQGTAIGDGIAIPHVRTLKVRQALLGFARCTRGVEFDAPDGKPVHLFFPIVGPPYEDRVYHRVYHALGELLQSAEVRARLLHTHDAGEVYRLLNV